MNEQRDTERMLELVAQVNAALSHDFAIVVECIGLDATAIVLWTDPAGMVHVMARRAGVGWRDAIQRALRWLGQLG